MQSVVNHKENFMLIGYRDRSWEHEDDPKQWLIDNVTRTRPSLKDAAEQMVNEHVLVIHKQPQQNSSTIYLIDDRFLFFNRVVFEENGAEKKTYYVQDLDSSIVRLLVKRGFEDLFHRAKRHN